MAARTEEEMAIRQIVFDCTKSMQSEINHLRDTMLQQKADMDRLLTVNETVIKLLGARIS